MAVIIEFNSKEDRLKAIDFLAEAEEGYEGLPKRHFLVSNKAARILKDRNVKFQVIGGKEEEDHYVSCP